ncbi:hypothetical protein E4U59_002285, partial [Claviceps monticola]
MYDGLADQIQKRLSYCFESGETLEWNAVAFLLHLEVLLTDFTSVKVERLELRRLRQASDEQFSDYLVRFEAQMAIAHRLDAPEDEKVELLHQSISSELDELCRHRTIPAHSYAEAVAVFKDQEAEQRDLELRNLIRTMTTADPNISTLEAGSDKGTNTTVVARTGFSGKSRKSKPGGKKGVKMLVFSKKPVLATTGVFVPLSEPASSVGIFGSAVVIVRMRLRSSSGE